MLAGCGLASDGPRDAAELSGPLPLQASADPHAPAGPQPEPGASTPFRPDTVEPLGAPESQSEPEPGVPFRLTRNGRSIGIEVLRPVYSYTCSDEFTTVVKRSAGVWEALQDDRTLPFGASATGFYYLDDTFIAPGCDRLMCDDINCLPAADRVSVDAAEYIAAGTRPSPTLNLAEYDFVGRCTGIPEGSELDADAGTVRLEAPVYRTRVPEVLAVTFEYHLASDCSDPQLSETFYVE